MIRTRSLFTALVLLLASLSVQAQMLKKEPYSDKRFAELQATNAVVLIDVYAPWCPTCKKQQEILAAYRKANPAKKFIILDVDYDNQREAVRFFKAPRQSTLLIYRGNKQHWFSVAETRAEVIAEALDKAIAYNYKAKHAD
jgi:thioredoxin 1